MREMEVLDQSPQVAIILVNVTHVQKEGNEHMCWGEHVLHACHPVFIFSPSFHTAEELGVGYLCECVA